MKKLIQISVVILSMLFVAGIASATTYTYGDDYTEWPGYTTSNNGVDVIGNGPNVYGMTVTTYDSGNLESITVYISDLTSNRLFINLDWTADESYDNWDLYAIGVTYTKLYQITGDYTYTYADYYNWRVDHPNGIEVDDSLTQVYNLLISVVYDSETKALTYYFVDSDLLALGDSFVIGFSTYCANDVFLTPVPEPATMLLLGLGLVGAAAIRRKIK